MFVSAIKSRANVGTMAAVAGAMAEYVGWGKIEFLG